MDWYKKTPDVLVKELHTSITQGLTSENAKLNLEKYGSNELRKEEKKSLLTKLIAQLVDPMILILLLAAILSGIVGELTDTFIILAIVVTNAILSLYQEGKAEAAIEALQKMASPNAKVLRDGRQISIPSTELVPGDVVILETGDIVPADLRLFESSNLKIDESSLTGESVAVEKSASIHYSDAVEIGDRQNMAYSSTIVSYGRGAGLVVETGIGTEIGKIAVTISAYQEEQTPLQKKLAQLSKMLGIIVIGVSVLVFAVGLLYGLPILEMFLTSISLAVAAIPEGLPAIVTIVLSLGMGRMAKRHAIVKKLLAVETLGTTTVICSDKTGTLTQNEMTVTKAYVDGVVIDVTGTGYAPQGKYLVNGQEISEDGYPSLFTLLTIATLTNDAKLEKTETGYKMIGDPTEGALLTFAGKKGLTREKLNHDYPRIEEIPFDSDRKMMTTFHSNFIENKVVSFTKGAPDIITDRCAHIMLDGQIIPLTPEMKQEILDRNDTFARQALRVLAYAMRSFDAIPIEHDAQDIENNMVFIGLTGMIDPARPEAKDAIKECRTAGIIPIMITGDYLETAYAIGKDLGIADSEDMAIMGRELNTMSEGEIRQIVKTKRIFARVSPENKVQIVTALRNNGHIAAMTGDGVNDAPAIKKADIGISMGITGTDVAKNTADVILTDDNFATIVAAVKEGRIIFSNIKKFVSFLLSCNISEILIILVCILINLPVPLIPIQLLWLNLVSDSFPALALGVEQGEEDIMQQPPRNPKDPILDRGTSLIVGIQSITITIGTLLAYLYGLQHYGSHIEGARTVTFATLIVAELFQSFSFRSAHYTLNRIGPFTNQSLLVGTALSAVLMILVIYVPGINTLFQTVPLGLKEWSVILVCSLIPLITGELYKAIRFRNVTIK